MELVWVITEHSACAYTHTHTHTHTHMFWVSRGSSFTGHQMRRGLERALPSIPSSTSAKEDHQPDTEVPRDRIRSRNTHTLPHPHTQALTTGHVETSVKTLLGTGLRTHELRLTSVYYGFRANDRRSGTFV